MIEYAPAKINIGLYVTSKREDNYHNIESLFYPIKLFDIIEIIESNTTKITELNIKTECSLNENLCFKAWNLLHQKFKIPSVEIFLFKQIPLMSGLGGGSSNAVTVLKMLNTKFQLQLSNSDLEHYALSLGSDCPFFVKSEASLVYGRGEILKSFSNILKGKYLLLVKPILNSSTKVAFSKINIQKNDNLHIDLNKNIELWKFNVKNVFEEVILFENPELKEIKNNLYAIGAVYVSMSGSGTAFYGIFNKKPENYSTLFNETTNWLIELD